MAEIKEPRKEKKKPAFRKSPVNLHLSHTPDPWLGELTLAMQCGLETLRRGAQAFVFLSTGLEEASLMLEGGREEGVPGKRSEGAGSPMFSERKMAFVNYCC